jgi:hypothetical protein
MPPERLSVHGHWARRRRSQVDKIGAFALSHVEAGFYIVVMKSHRRKHEPVRSPASSSSRPPKR